MKRLRLAAAALLCSLASPALASPEVVPGPEGTIIVMPAPVVVSAPAAGPPGAAEVPPQPMATAAAPAPQNEHWSNVSHINGTPVPVGERGNYLHRWKKT